MQRYTIEMPSWFPHIVIDVDAAFHAVIAVLIVFVIIKFIHEVRNED